MNFVAGRRGNKDHDLCRNNVSDGGGKVEADEENKC